MIKAFLAMRLKVAKFTFGGALSCLELEALLATAKKQLIHQWHAVSSGVGGTSCNPITKTHLKNQIQPKICKQ